MGFESRPMSITNGGCLLALVDTLLDVPTVDLHMVFSYCYGLIIHYIEEYGESKFKQVLIKVLITLV